MSINVLDTRCIINMNDSILVSISSVLILTLASGQALYSAGILRSKHTQNNIMQVLASIFILGLLWYTVGYSLTFSGDLVGLIGNFENSFLNNVDVNTCSPHAPTIPSIIFSLFMMTFSSITPAIMATSVAERLSWRSYLILIILWELLVYYPIAHWVWGNGWLSKIGVLDYAGGLVVNVNIGIGALVLSLMTGRRAQFFKYSEDYPPSNLPLSMIGLLMFYLSWIGMSIGRALGASSVAVNALVSTHLCSLSSGLMSILISWITNKPSSISVMMGFLGGVSAIAPASGYIGNREAIILGLLIGLLCHISKWLIKSKLHIDDALYIISTNGIPGIIGTLCIGLCANSLINPKGANGIIYGGDIYLLGVQSLAICVTMAYSGLMTFLIASLLKWTIGLRISPEEEDIGLDVVVHGEYAYYDLWMMPGIERAHIPDI